MDSVFRKPLRKFDQIEVKGQKQERRKISSPVLSTIKKIRNLYVSYNINSWVIFYILVYIILIIKMITIEKLNDELFFKIYSITVSVYILSRFVFSYFHEHDHPKYRKNDESTISFGVPSKNEGENIKETILRIANSDYPKHKFNIIAINDGSDDNTLEEMLKAQELATRGG